MAKKQPPKKGKGGKPQQPFAQLPPSLDIRKVGRPSKYDRSFCDLVMDLGSQGKSLTQMARLIGVHPETLTNWGEVHPEFFDALKNARALSMAWWEDLGQMNMTRQGFNATAFIFQMKNRFPADYKDRHEVAGDPKSPIVHEVKRTIVDPRAG